MDNFTFTLQDYKTWSANGLCVCTTGFLLLVHPWSTSRLMLSPSNWKHSSSNISWNIVLTSFLSQTVCGNTHMLTHLFPLSVLRFTLQLSFLCLHTNPHTDPGNSNLTTTARHSLTPSILMYLCQPYSPFQGPSERDYIQWATSTSSANQPGWTASDQNKKRPFWPTKFIHSERSSCQQCIKKRHIKMEDKTPDCLATKPRGLGTPPLIRTSCQQHPTQPCDSTSRSLLNSIADFRPVNHAASGTSSLGADRRPCHYTATQLYTAVIITQQQTKTKSWQVSWKPYSPDCTTR